MSNIFTKSQKDEFKIILNDFIQLREKFKEINDYEEKLKFWRNNSLTSLVYGIDYTNLSIMSWHNKVKNLVINGGNVKNKFLLNNDFSVDGVFENNFYDEYISIVPVDEFQTEKLLNFVYDEKLDKFEIDPVKMIEVYWDQIKRSPLPKEYLTNKNNSILLITDKYLNSNTSKVILSGDSTNLITPFKVGYNQVMNGEFDINYRDIFKHVYSNESKASALNYSIPSVAYNLFLHGRAIATFKGFLTQQMDRMNKGEDIKNLDINNLIGASEIESNKDIITSKQQSLLIYYLRRIKVVNIDFLDEADQNKNIITILSYLFNRKRENTRKNFRETFIDP